MKEIHIKASSKFGNLDFRSYSKCYSLGFEITCFILPWHVKTKFSDQFQPVLVSTVTLTMNVDSYIDSQGVIQPCGNVAVAENSKAYVAIDVPFLKRVRNG